MKTVSVVVCNSGLGHLKRVLWILDGVLRFLKDELAFDVFVDARKLKAFAAVVERLQADGRVRFHDIASDVLNYERDFMTRYEIRLRQAHVVWSDNMSFPLRYHNRVFLTGQFLWSENIADKDFKETEVKILQEKHPAMFGIRYFATPDVKKYTAFEGTGIYNFGSLKAQHVSGNAILLACGGTESANAHFQKELSAVVERAIRIPEEITIFVEPRYFERFPKRGNIKKADFTEEMFGYIKAAVIRPGMGTVCDVLSKGGRVFAFMEGGNFEIEHNATVLEQLGIGHICGSIADGVDAATDFLRDTNAREKHLTNIDNLDFNGVDDLTGKIGRAIGGCCAASGVEKWRERV